MQVCVKCHKEQPDNMFVRSQGKGTTKFCLACRNRQREYSNRYHGGDYSTRRRDYRFQKAYGITEAQYLDILHSQEGKCAICRREPTERLLAVDHCHKTNQVRGLLCQCCNLGLGGFQDSTELLQEAIKYLVKS